MTTETIEAGSSTFTPAEEAFFSSGGESAIPAEGGEGAAPAVGAASEAAPGDAAAPVTHKDGDHVPLARFLDEKKGRKELDKQNRDLQIQIADLRGKFSIIERLGPAGEQQEQPKAPPTAEEDIFGAVKHVGETVAQMQKRLDDADAATKATAEQTAFANNYLADAAQFEAKTSDYRPAYNFLFQSRASELIAIGFENPMVLQANGHPLEEIQAAAKALHDAVVADEYGIAQLAMSKGKSAAEIIYGLAKQRGYKAAVAAGADGEAGKGAETLDRIERGQAANKSLSTPGGASGDPGMTAERLLAMSMDEFETWTTKNPAAAKRIMGG